MRTGLICILAPFLLLISHNLEADTRNDNPATPLFVFFTEKRQDVDETLHFFENRSAVKRLAEVEINEAIRSLVAIKAGDKLTIALFGETNKVATVQRTDINRSDTRSLTAQLAGKQGYLVLATTGNRCLGSIFLPGQNLYYKIISDPYTHKHYILELDTHDRDIILGQTAHKKHGIPVIDDQQGQGYNISRQPLDAPAEHATIDIMMVYTPAAKMWANQHGGGIENVIALSLANTQLVHDNSQTMVNFSIAYIGLVDYEETGISQIDLWRLTASPTYNPYGLSVWGGYGIPGYLNEVHELRNQYSADLCVLFTYTYDTGGMAHTLNSKHGQPKHAFSIVRVQQSAFSYTKAHELGHNLGCHHHKDQLSQPGPTSWTNWPENTWSAGWRWQSNENQYYCTVMTYEPGFFFNDGITHTRIPYYSNPGVSYLGASTGHPDDGDNLRTIRKMKHIVASYRVPGMALVSTNPVSDIALFGASSGGHVIVFEGHPVLQRGLVWDTEPYPTLDRNKGHTTEKGGEGPFTSRASGLEAATSYYITAYATNDAGTAYGGHRFFTTPEPSSATISTRKASKVGHNFAIAGGTVSKEGNSEVSMRGVVWSTTPNPTIDANDGITHDGTGAGAFESRLSGLKSGQRYFYRAYSTNYAGTVYGVQFFINTPLAGIFPNPFNDKLEIAFQNESKQGVTIVLKNLHGQVVKRKEVNQAGDIHEVLNVSHLKGGYYLLTIEGEQDFPVWPLLKTEP